MALQIAELGALRADANRRQELARDGDLVEPSQ